MDIRVNFQYSIDIDTNMNIIFKNKYKYRYNSTYLKSILLVKFLAHHCIGVCIGPGPDQTGPAWSEDQKGGMAWNEDRTGK